MLNQAIASTCVQPHFSRVGALTNYFQQLIQEFDRLPQYLRQFVMDNQRRYETMPVCPPRPDGGFTLERNTGSEATVKSGDKTYEFKKDGMKFSITSGDGKTAMVWGDPHYTGADGKTVDIHGDSVTTLEDGTRIFLKTSNAKGERETDPSAPTYTKSVAIVRPDGSATFIDNVTGDKPLEISTPRYGQMPLDFVREKMNGDFKPEAYLSIDSKGRWTDMNGLPLTQESANAMRDIARSQEPLSAALASGCFANGLFPRSLWDNPGFDPQVRNSQYYGGLEQTQELFEQALRGGALSQIAMSGPMGDLMMQILGQGLGNLGVCGLGQGGWLGALLGGEGCGDDNEMSLPMLMNPQLLRCAYGGAEDRVTPGYAAATLASHNARTHGGRLTLDEVRSLASNATDARVRGSAQFIVDDYERNGPRSMWARLEARDPASRFGNGVSQRTLERFSEDAGYGGFDPLARPYTPPMPDWMEQAFLDDFMRGGMVRRSNADPINGRARLQVEPHNNQWRMQAVY
ncbi:MAG: hypothetical protein KA795_03310 [Burkholderiaceae bacterium]|nr:hypothetical protein [Burkholderiaceae bacterium]